MRARTGHRAPYRTTMPAPVEPAVALPIPPATPADGVLLFMERLLVLLGQGSFTTTYKYALLLALIDLCADGAGEGKAPSTLTTLQVAEKLLTIYWPHSKPFQGQVLDQSSTRHGGRQARSELGVLAGIRRLRQRTFPDDTSPFRAKRKDERAYLGLVRDVQWILIKQAIPRLQIVGTFLDQFLYDVRWRIASTTSPVLIDGSRTIGRADVGSEDFDDVLRFQPGVQDHLVQLAPVLRPLIMRQWTLMVERLNGRSGELLLEDHLFGQERSSLAELQPGLLSMQEGRCFYCCHLPRGAPLQVDHFLPWARHPEDALGNLVVAHARCNLNKSDFIADIPHALAWANRDAAALQALAAERRWPLGRRRTLSAAAMVYGRLRPGMRLWTADGNLVGSGDPAPLLQALRSALAASAAFPD